MTNQTPPGSAQLSPPSSASSGADAPRALTLDVEKYQRYLDDPRSSDDQKRQVIEALWTIIVGFVDLGFGVHPAQQVCGQVHKEGTQNSQESSGMLYSADQSDFNNNGQTAPSHETVTEKD
ncbi:MAG: hypothetical protein Kilf2KO_34790 [Rhodospirillales bacterium]